MSYIISPFFFFFLLRFIKIFKLILSYLSHSVIIILQILIIIIGVLISIAYLTLLERKGLASFQARKGPNKVGVFGLLQPLSDGLKLFCKEIIIPSNADRGLFITAPIFTFLCGLLGWSIIPFDRIANFATLNISILYVMAITSLNVYGIIFAGWASNSKYSFLGSLRSVSQMIAYELPMAMCLLTVCLCAGSFNLSQIVENQTVWYIFPLLPLFFIFIICGIAETNRHPFDLPEAESELVSGYNTEYSGSTFALFFLGEYANMLFLSGMTTILFLGGWRAPFGIILLPGSFWFSLKLVIIVFIFIIARAAVPRYRYDQLMNLGWKVLLPFSFAYFFFITSILFSFNYLC